MCGIVGTLGNPQVVPRLLQAMVRMQGRGNRGHGLFLMPTAAAGSPVDLSLLYKSSSSIKYAQLADLPEHLRRVFPAGSMRGIGHVRYPTALIETPGAPPKLAKSDDPKNVQPIVVTLGGITTVVAFNGEIENHSDWQRRLAEQGYTCETQNDAEVLAYIICREIARSGDVTAAIRFAIRTLGGAFSAVLLTNASPALYAFTDKERVRPLWYGLQDGYHIVCSETYPIVSAHGSVLGEIPGGSILTITSAAPGDAIHTNATIETLDNLPPPRHCSMEHAYLEHFDSQLPDGQLVINGRMRLGRLYGEFLLRTQPKLVARLDGICPIPNSGISFSQGLAQALGLPYLTPISVDPTYDERTFLLPSQTERRTANGNKLVFNPELIRGKRYGFGDDSVIRGNVAKKAGEQLDANGILEKHLFSSFPQHRFACPSGGFATNQTEHLLAHKYGGDTQRIAAAIHWNSVGFTTPAMVAEAFGEPLGHLCFLCTTGSHLQSHP